MLAGMTAGERAALATLLQQMAIASSTAAFGERGSAEPTDVHA
jgi:hypothetical protein